MVVSLVAELGDLGLSPILINPLEFKGRCLVAGAVLSTRDPALNTLLSSKCLLRGNCGVHDETVEADIELLASEHSIHERTKVLWVIPSKLDDKDAAVNESVG